MTLTLERDPITEPITAVRPGRRRPLVLSAVLTGLGWAAAMLLRLFAGGTVGMADQTDGRRLLCSLGLTNPRPFNADITRYLYPTWVNHHWYGETCGAEGSGEPYYSTQTGLLWVAKQLGGLFGFPGALDTRMVGVLCSLLVGLLCGGFVLVLPGRLWLRITLSCAFGLIYADEAFAGYFVSPYSEPGSLLGIGALVLTLLGWWRSARWPWLLGVVAAATFLVGTKTQMVSFAVVAVVGLLWTRGPWRRRLPGCTLSALLLLGTAGYLVAQPARFGELNQYHAVFSEILADSPDPRADLRDLGLDPALAKAAGTDIGSPGSAAAMPQYRRFRETIGWSSIGLFYLEHPGRLGGLIGTGLDGMAVLRPPYLGSYPADSGQPPGTVEHRLSVYSTLWIPIRLAPGLLVVVWLATLGTGLAVAHGRRFDPARRAIGRLAVCLPIGVAGQFAVVMFTEGRVEVTKHLTEASFLTALSIPVLVACTGMLLGRRRRRPGQFVHKLPLSAG